MRTRTHSFFSQLNNGNALRSALRQAAIPLSLFVMLGVFWCLKLNGITMAGEAFCGFAEHIHGPDCPMQELICQLPEVQPHTHSESCISSHLICPQEERPAHSHDAGCLAQELICELPEQEAHIHSDDCHAKTLTCSLEEYEGHSHRDSCYDRKLLCTLPEEESHSHSEDCYSRCDLPEAEAHTHDDSCMSVICGLSESEQPSLASPVWKLLQSRGHTHSDACMALTCERPETAGHTHSDSCIFLICDRPETDGHSHGESCYESTLLCSVEEDPGHSHNLSCYILEETLICEPEEIIPHAHTSECFIPIEGSYICQLEETPGHTHADDCWQSGIGFGCGLTEAEGHVHSAECITAETELGCGLEETPGHLHAEGCFNTLETCPLVEHIHTENCYSDLSADLETEDDWDDIQNQLTDDLSLADTLVELAHSQLGYEESILNFQVDAEGIRRGITRYGQWYGNPYGDWSAMFVSFCLHYAGAEDLPANAGPEAMRLEWWDAELYREAYLFHPEPGYLLFLDKNQNEQADAVAIITQVENGQITAIEGDLDDRVVLSEYALTDEVVMGYGSLPKPESLMFQPAEGPTLVAKTEADNETAYAPGDLLVVYVEDPSGLYALDGFGGYVELSMEEDGSLFSLEGDPMLLFWKVFSVREDGSYEIRNAETGMYLEAALPPTTYANGSQTNQSYGVQLAAAKTYTVYLDGTNGNLMSLRGSDSSSYTVTEGGTFALPSTWKTPYKYGYTLKGWYDVASGAYYPAGGSMTVTKTCLLYADWVAQTYDLGEMNRYVTDTVSTAQFVTTHVFDYNSLFNTLSLSNNYNGGSSTQWTLVSKGKIKATDKETLNFIFVDHDSEGTIHMPRERNNENGVVYQQITPNLYNDALADILFDPEVEVIGKHYLGTGDYLFQYCNDPANKEYYGYYFYDSRYNAASYNQSQQRFYVYDYLARTTDSGNNSSYSDFLPLNSPYANINGRTVGTYSYDGIIGEYAGTTHYSYDTKYDSDNNGNSTNHVMTNFGFGMATELEFYLAATPGTKDTTTGKYINQSMTGEEMIFEFTGDDDLWVLIDGKLMLDIGGIHQEESGSINFSTGEVIVDGKTASHNVTHLAPGNHTLTMYYLERGGSMSNFKLRFNLSTRYSLNLRKEDTLTADLLNGAQFSVYLDQACTIPAELWNSRESHDKKEKPTNVFTVKNGSAYMWGLSAGGTYYIKETLGPDAYNNVPSKGLIRLYLNNHGEPDYQILSENNTVTPGFTVHGFKVDEDSQQAYLVATNSPPGVQTTTQITAIKQWNDNKNHDGESVTVYLTATAPDNTVTRLQEATLSSANKWQHTWTNLPMYHLGNDNKEDTSKPVVYSVEESYVSGYYSQTKRLTEGSYSETTISWSECAPGDLKDGQIYLLKSSQGYLSTLNATASDTGYRWVAEDVAKDSLSAQWKVTKNGDQFKLTNLNGQTLTFYYNGGSPTDFFASTGGETNESKQYYRYATDKGKQFRLYYDGANNKDYYLISSTTDASKFKYSTTKNDGLLLTAVEKTQQTVTATFKGTGVLITNTPLEKETSLTVNKVWDYGKSTDDGRHNSYKVTVDLLANGSPTGRTVTLSLKNDWQDTFRGLPYTDANGKVIDYTVEERWDNNDWVTRYGPVQASSGDPPIYNTTIVNEYRWGSGGPELPSTGTMGRTLYQLCGGSIMLLTLACAVVLRRKREGGRK